MALVLTMREFIWHVVDGVVRRRAAPLIGAVERDPRRTGEQRRRQTVIADCRGELGNGQRALLVLRDIFLA